MRNQTGLHARRGPSCSPLFRFSILAEDPPSDIRELKLRDWQPKSMMVHQDQHSREARSTPVIDIHNHLGGGKDRLTEQVRESVT